jgi:hypothetical protein
MNPLAQSLAPLRSVAITITAVLAAVVAVAVGRRTGMLEPELAKRSGVLTFGIMLAVLGNYLPKFVVPWSTPATVAARRFAGWVFVVAGGAYVAACLLAPMPQAVVASSVIGIGAFVLAGANWMRVVGHTAPLASAAGEATGDAQAPAPPDEDLAVGFVRAAPLILLGLFFAFVMFLTDALWGDDVVEWMAVGYCLAIGIWLPFLKSGRWGRTGSRRALAAGRARTL